MSNTKDIVISGKLPFNLLDKSEYGEAAERLRGWLATMNTPTWGMQLKWDTAAQEHRRNKYGGETAYYGFNIEGTEAVNWTALTSLVMDIQELGEVWTAKARDLDACDNPKWENLLAVHSA